MGNDKKQDPIFGDDAKDGQNTAQKKAGDGFYVQIWGVKIFKRRYRPVKPELDPLDVVRKLLEDFEHEESINKSRSIVHLHRIIENTHARRRLEKWSLRVIATYLLIVFGIIIATYAKIPFLGFPILNIPPNIMVAILTTTTANIIGLGLIVLRGHFLAKEADKEDKT